MGLRLCPHTDPFTGNVCWPGTVKCCKVSGSTRRGPPLLLFRADDRWLTPPKVRDQRAAQNLDGANASGKLSQWHDGLCHGAKCCHYVCRWTAQLIPSHPGSHYKIKIEVIVWSHFSRTWTSAVHNRLISAWVESGHVYCNKLFR